MISRTTKINEETGEIFSQKDTKFTIFDADKGYLFRAKNFSVKSYLDIKLSDVVTDDMDYMRCHKLAEHIYKDTNTIAIRYGKKNRMADLDDICNIINMSPRRTKDFVTRMQKLHVLAVRTDCIGDVVQIKYVFNPLFFSSNKFLHSDLYFLFQSSLDKYLPAWVTQSFHDASNIKK